MQSMKINKINGLTYLGLEFESCKIALLALAVKIHIVHTNARFKLRQLREASYRYPRYIRRIQIRNTKV